MVFKKIAAAAAAALMASAIAVMPVNNIITSAYDNIISNSDFSTGTTDWGIYKESGGSASLSAENGRLVLDISSVGKLSYSVQMFYDIVPLYKNGVYHISYEISSDTDRVVEAMIQQNGGTYQAYTWKQLSLTSQPQTVDYNFTMEADTDIMSKLVFNCGYEGEDPGAHKIYLDNVVLELVDDSDVDYSSVRAYEPPIVVNQVGYKPDDKKIAVFRGVGSDKSFSVADAATGAVVYTGELYGETVNSNADETDWLGDFSSVDTPGKYYIKCGDLDNSYTFEIGDNVYSNLLDSSVRMLYLQRCGITISDSDFGHVPCHTETAKVYGTSEYIDVSGGWHDAGDYGRYTVPAAKTVADLLNAYSANPEMFSDSTGIPESGNGTPDILDEARCGLEWMLKMQTSDGGVYHKVTCESFPGYVMPEMETDELIVTPVSSTATADFCAATAMGYEFYKDIDIQFAEKCLAASQKAWSYLEANPDFNFTNPDDITTGEYGDRTDLDERYWAAAQLYRSTGGEKYKTALEGMSAKTGMDWATVGDYGNIAIVGMEGIDKTSSIYTRAKDSILSQAAVFLSRTESSPYGVALTTFNWGSNMTVSNAGVILGLAAQLSDDSSYMDAAKSNLSYLLGKNPNGVCYVTGFGTVSPENPHHRPSMAQNKAMKGMLVGGVNSAKEDSAAKAYLAGVAPAKCYVDHSESYSTNEITTYWNSPLIYLMAVSEDGAGSQNTATNLKGDVNCDNTVNTADITLLKKYLLKITDLNESQWANADMDSSDCVNAFDFVYLKRVLTGAVTPPDDDEPTVSDEPDSTATMTADFRIGASSYFEASDGWTNGSPFDCGWYASNAAFADNALNLTIDKDASGKYNYSAAEYRTKSFYGYGYYETSMQAIKNDGVVSSFFTYTGPSDNNPWDEIDVEILGKDTTKVQFNYYTNGVGGHEYMYDLGFDASEGFHRYGFDWQPDHITWYVDGKAVYTASSNIPSTPAKIMMNVWPGIGVDSWLNPYNGNTPLTAKYQWVTFREN
ncbi:MAG: glycoside hydrolase family 9 protein [Porcipelethomonas sp.]